MSRAPVQDPWPWPADSPLDRRGRVARAYRDRLAKEAPEACAEVDAVMRRLQQNWVLPKQVTLEPDDLLTVEQAADAFDVKPRTIDTWHGRGLKQTLTADGLRYRVGDIWDYLAERRQQRRAALANPPDP